MTTLALPTSAHRSRTLRNIRDAASRGAWLASVCTLAWLVMSTTACQNDPTTPPTAPPATSKKPYAPRLSNATELPEILGTLCYGSSRDDPPTTCPNMTVSANPGSFPDTGITAPLTIRFSRAVHHVSLHLNQVIIRPPNCYEDIGVPCRFLVADSAPGRIQAYDSTGKLLYDHAAESYNSFTLGPPGVRTVTYTPSPGVFYRYDYAWEMYEFAEQAALTIDSVQAAGPNENGSFTTATRERTIRLHVALSPDSARRNAQVTWEIVSDPHQKAKATPPTTTPHGLTTQFTVPAQPVERWQHFTTLHGTLPEKALSYQIRAHAVWHEDTVVSQPVTVTQSELDALRQEYLDLDVPIPPITSVHRQGDGTISPSMFTRINKGDYQIAYLLPTLNTHFTQLENMTGTLPIVGGFEDPVHHRFHVAYDTSRQQRPTLQSEHQQGNAIDVSTRTTRTAQRDRWHQIHTAALALQFCVNPVERSAGWNLHLQLRNGPDSCPQGW